MPGKKSDWVTKAVELKDALPKGFDARAFRGAKVEGKLDKAKVAKIAEEKGMKDKVDAVMAYLNHAETKPAAKKGKGKKQAVETCSPKTLLSKRTYSVLSATEIDKLMAILPEIKKARKEKELALLDEEEKRIQKRKKELQGK